VVDWHPQYNKTPLSSLTGTQGGLDHRGSFHEKIALALAEARRQAELAYEFVPGSYTHSALVAIRAAEKAVASVDPDRWGSA
jgi:hypothetical protein